MEFKDSETRINLMRSFAGESQARTRYAIAAETARKEKLYIIEEIFNYTAKQELAHASRFMKALKDFKGEEIEIDAAYPVSKFDTTLEELQHAKEGEFHEHDEVYKSFAETAKNEGFDAIAKLFNDIASIEKVHGTRFAEYEKDLREGTLFKKNTSVTWMCTNCGFILEGTDAPLVCPVCLHEQGYFKVLQQ
ncbi:rubrerythrin family protein [Clostridium bornimense]|uniref:rubrerythrin n=1 Tax=Clostridium bornimense TaxID=1216932 RepID=UPI001C10F5C7|nr:rubrerythrin family protein [Clostridium bornimense]MBU5317178.1 rubrerythrin family protein [Clostridium bornimense]